MYGEKRGVFKVLVGNLRDRYHLEEQGVDGRIILKWIFRKWDWVMDWNHMAQNRDRWQAPVNAVIKFRVP